jgi:hypothetical protein
VEVKASELAGETRTPLDLGVLMEQVGVALYIVAVSRDTLRVPPEVDPVKTHTKVAIQSSTVHQTIVLVGVVVVPGKVQSAGRAVWVCTLRPST